MTANWGRVNDSRGKVCSLKCCFPLLFVAFVWIPMRRLLPDVAEKGGLNPSSVMGKWLLSWPWYQRSITLRNVAVPSPLKQATLLSSTCPTVMILRNLQHHWPNTWHPGPDVTDAAPALVPDMKARIQLMNDPPVTARCQWTNYTRASPSDRPPCGGWWASIGDAKTRLLALDIPVQRAV